LALKEQRTSKRKIGRRRRRRRRSSHARGAVSSSSINCCARFAIGMDRRSINQRMMLPLNISIAIIASDEFSRFRTNAGWRQYRNDAIAPTNVNGVI